MKIIRNLFVYLLGFAFILIGIIMILGGEFSDGCCFAVFGIGIMGFVPAILLTPKSSDSVFDTGNMAYAIVYGATIIAFALCVVAAIK